MVRSSQLGQGPIRSSFATTHRGRGVPDLKGGGSLSRAFSSLVMVAILSVSPGMLAGCFAQDQTNRQQGAGTEGAGIRGAAAQGAGTQAATRSPGIVKLDELSLQQEITETIIKDTEKVVRELTDSDYSDALKPLADMYAKAKAAAETGTPAEKAAKRKLATKLFVLKDRTARLAKSAESRHSTLANATDAGTQAVRTQAAGTQAAGTQAAGTQAAGTQAAGTQAAGTQTAGTQAAGTQAAGTQAAGTQAAGTQAAGTQAAGTQAAGTQAAGTQAAGTQAAGTQAAGTQAAGTQAAGTQAAGTQAAGTQAAGTQAAGTQAAGTQAAGTQAAGTQAAGTQAAGTQAQQATQAAGTQAAGTQVAGTQAAGTQAAGTQAAGTQAAGTQAAGTQAAGTQAAGTQAAGTQAAGTQAAGTQAAGTQAAGTQAAGTQAAGTQAAGTQAAGTQAAGTQAAGTQAAGTQAAGTQAAGTQAAGTQAAGTQAAGTQAAGTQAMGTRGAGTRAAGTQAAATAESKVVLVKNEDPLYTVFIRFGNPPKRYSLAPGKETGTDLPDTIEISRSQDGEWTPARPPKDSIGGTIKLKVNAGRWLPEYIPSSRSEGTRPGGEAYRPHTSPTLLSRVNRLLAVLHITAFQSEGSGTQPPSSTSTPNSAAGNTGGPGAVTPSSPQGQGNAQRGAAPSQLRPRFRPDETQKEEKADSDKRTDDEKAGEAHEDGTLVGPPKIFAKKVKDAQERLKKLIKEQNFKSTPEVDVEQWSTYIETIEGTDATPLEKAGQALTLAQLALVAAELEEPRSSAQKYELMRGVYFTTISSTLMTQVINGEKPDPQFLQLASDTLEDLQTIQPIVAERAAVPKVAGASIVDLTRRIELLESQVVLLTQPRPSQVVPQEAVQPVPQTEVVQPVPQTVPQVLYCYPARGPFSRIFGTRR